MVTIRNHTFETYISEEEILAKISNVAEQINKEYKDCSEYPVFLITLSGAIFFSVELLKKIDFNTKIGFIKCSSYADGMTSSGKITVPIEPTIEIKDKEVIVLEDIIDTGLTWEYLHKYLTKLGAKNVRIATMLLKDTKIDSLPQIDWYGMKSENKFIIGMGLDYGELGRNLPAIYKLKD